MPLVDALGFAMRLETHNPARLRFTIASFMIVIAVLAVLLSISGSALVTTVAFCLIMHSYCYVHHLFSAKPSFSQRKTLEELMFLKWETRKRSTPIS
jgi:hypothetical protein